MLNALQINWTHENRFFYHFQTYFKEVFVGKFMVTWNKREGCSVECFIISHFHLLFIFLSPKAPVTPAAGNSHFTCFCWCIFINYENFIYKRSHIYMEKSNYRNQCINKYPIPIMKPMQLSVGARRAYWLSLTKYYNLI